MLSLSSATSARSYLGLFVLTCMLVFLGSYSQLSRIYTSFNYLFVTGSNSTEKAIVPSGISRGSVPAYVKDPLCFVGPEGSNVTPSIYSIRYDPCYRDRFREDFDPRDCSCLGNNENYTNKVSYIIPDDEIRNETRKPLNKSELAHDVIFAFIHLNKAGGTTIKKEILIRSAIRNKWDAAAFGSFSAWKALGKKTFGAKKETSTKYFRSENAGNFTIEDQEIHRLYKVEPLYLRCGEMISKSKLSLTWTYRGIRKCRLRVIWGALTMGLCDHFPDRPCVYFTVLRNPLDRAISNYNYVCIQGAENRKKWLPEWKEQDHCPLTLLEFFELGFIGPNKLIERMTRGCDTRCGIEAAIENLKNPCMRFLLLDKLRDGLYKLRDTFGTALKPEIRRLLASHRHRNTSPYNARVMNQINNPEIIRQVKKKLELDIKFYEAAQSLYEQQWEKPLVSCN